MAIGDDILARFRTFAHEFVDVENDDVLEYITNAQIGQSAAAWGSAYTLAMAYLAAHLMKLMPTTAPETDNPTDAAGPVTSKKAGDLAIGFQGLIGSGSAEKDDLRATRYGKAYLALRRTRSARGPTTILPRNTRET